MSKQSKRIQVGSVPVGGGAPVSVQTMTNTVTEDVEATLAQIDEVARVGCDIIRVTVPDSASAVAFAKITEASPIPVVADIHFDYRLALAAIEGGASGVRVNPGNLGGRERVEAVAHAARAARVPIRVGANSGSLPQDLLERFGGVTPAGLVEAALRFCREFEKAGWDQLKVSLKSSNVRTTVDACRLFSQRSDYPQHIGVTEAGTPAGGIIKSAVGIGALLLDGIGDTLRVSLTGPLVEEVRTGIRILEAVGLRQAAPEIVSCPTCGRTRIALQPLVEAVEDKINDLKARGFRIELKKIALMGCIVNGPGEARDADLGLAGGKGKGAIFSNGEILCSLPEDELLPALLERIEAKAVLKK